MGRFQRGDLIYVNLGYKNNRSVQQGERPCVVVSNNINNAVSPVLLVCPCTSRMSKKKNPVHVTMEKEDVKGFLPKRSIILVEQLISIDKKQILKKMGRVTSGKVMKELNGALIKQLQLDKMKEENYGEGREDGGSDLEKAEFNNHGSGRIQ